MEIKSFVFSDFISSETILKNHNNTCMSPWTPGGASGHQTILIIVGFQLIIRTL